LESLKEIIVFSEQGDPREVKTWSNVPFLLVKTFEDKGIIVHTVNLDIQDYVQKVIRKIWDFFFIKVIKTEFYDYSRSSLYYFIIKFKIKAAIKRYINADSFIFTTFSFSASDISNKPNILFCDWTIEHHVKYYLNREPNFLEQLAINRQNAIIEKADAVFVLFPEIADTMKKRYSNQNIFYNGNVINNLSVSDAESIINKKNSKNLLFIGGPKYLNGALDLVKAYLILKETIPELKLNLVGIDQSDIDVFEEGITCHGYLDKGIIGQANKYYKLLNEATVFINTTPKWGAFSACVEAMYFYTPVIVTAYDEFIKTFGKSIDFGIYYNSLESNLSSTIKKILLYEDYNELCINAHDSVNGFTWDKYVDKMIETYNTI
jgi:glycosyltransferase involved in cell wall biosynthesis